VQLAAATALEDGAEEPRRMSALYHRRRDLVCDALREIGLDVTPPLGTIYVWVPVPEGHSSASYCELVLDESGVVLSPGAAYGPSGEGFFRISLTVPDERLSEAVERLRSSLGG
jgi:LL-diaminopimelate aminotransferase